MLCRPTMNQRQWNSLMGHMLVWIGISSGILGVFDIMLMLKS